MDSNNKTHAPLSEDTNEVPDEPQQAPVNVIHIAPAPFSEATFLLIEAILRCYANGSVATMGIITNLIAIIVFYRQGIFTNSSTVSLTTLGVIDFTCSVLNVYGAILSGIMFHDKNHYFYPIWLRDFWIFTSTRPMDMLTQITCWVTAYAAFERLISVIFPFKVKSIFTPMRSCIGLICMSLFILMLYGPVLFGPYTRWITEYIYGRVVTHIRYFENGHPLLMKSAHYLLRINTIGLKPAAVIVVVCCNVIIYWKVNLSQKFRKTSGSSTVSKPPPSVTNSEKNSDQDKNKATATISGKTENKEKKLLKMITAISIVFVTSYTPFIIFSFLITVVWEWRIDYHPFTEFILWSVTTLFQTINSSTNFFIYYIMSSRFREEFRVWCHGGKIA